MIDIRQVRTEGGVVKAALARRGIDTGVVDELIDLDERSRSLTTKRDEIRAAVKALSRQVGQANKGGDAAATEELRARSRQLGDDERALDTEAEAVATRLRDLLLVTPNLPAADCPDGADEHDNVVLRIEGYDPDAYGAHQRVPHWEIGESLGILDLERGARMSGSMFVVFRGLGAALARGLCQLALDRNVDAYEEIRPPTLVRTDTMISTGHLPKFADEGYHLERDDLWAIPTAEVPLTSLARGEILEADRLPMKVMAYTPCFRREAGAAGRDTRGLLRVHEFDKVELLAFATPDQAAEVHADILARAEGILRALGLAYRVVDLCAGDLGSSAARTFDLEVYAPGCDMWLEASSVSWFTDYQARRANVRYRSGGGTGRPGTDFVHTLNGSGLAVPRVWAALVETCRQPDGSVAVPEALRPYLRHAERITA
jgi:seryl-tRNA synthetase